ncbi:MAG: hypothetical protein ACI88C_000019 [Acidimicrobiales bacterium]|jgi:hypothetical protein
MSELLKLAAEIARGEYHPSHCVEDYRKGTGREAFAVLAGNAADRLRGRVRVLRDGAERIAELEAELKESRHATSREIRNCLEAERDLAAARVLIRVLEESERIGKAELDRLYAKYPSEERAHIYGHCPQCGAPGETRMTGVKGSNDRCTNGHFYASKAALGGEASDG